MVADQTVGSANILDKTVLFSKVTDFMCKNTQIYRQTYINLYPQPRETVDE